MLDHDFYQVQVQEGCGWILIFLQRMVQAEAGQGETLRSIENLKRDSFDYENNMDLLCCRLSPR